MRKSQGAMKWIIRKQWCLGWQLNPWLNMQATGRIREPSFLSLDFLWPSFPNPLWECVPPSFLLQHKPPPLICLPGASGTFLRHGPTAIGEFAGRLHAIHTLRFLLCWTWKSSPSGRASGRRDYGHRATSVEREQTPKVRIWALHTEATLSPQLTQLGMYLCVAFGGQG